MAMPLAALLMVLIHYALYSIVYQEDEGTAAHIFHPAPPGPPAPARGVLRAEVAARGSGALGVLALQAAAGLAAIVAGSFLI
jgi:hypothetical protein